jgi:hypothetical protein
MIDGVTITPKDVTGNVVDPFIYNGTTYLPVRAVGKVYPIKWTHSEHARKMDTKRHMVYIEPCIVDTDESGK